LIVAESQEAMLVAGGQMEGPFAAGRHTLDTENLPVFTSVLRLPFGGKSPFTAEVWFVNRSIPLDIHWGIEVPIQLEDPRYGVMLPVIASGQYGATVDHTKRFLTKFVGTMPKFDRQQLQNYLRGLIITRVKDLVAKTIVARKISILEISAYLNEISDELRAQIVPELNTYGLTISAFFVNTITAPEDDPAVQKMKMALANRAARNIEGYTYQQERSFDALQTAAGNEGSVGTVMGTGLGLGLGVGLGGTMGQAAQQTSFSAMQAPAAAGTVVDPEAASKRIALLREIAQLHKDGILSDDEFATEKKRILGVG
jgi:membrane protease subunit (stomatin/prohibitin family)